MRKVFKALTPAILILYIAALMPICAVAEEKVLYTAPPTTFVASDTSPQDAYIDISAPKEVATNTNFSIKITANSIQKPYTTYNFKKVEPKNDDPNWLTTLFESKEEKDKKRIKWDEKFNEGKDKNSTITFDSKVRGSTQSYMFIETSEAKNLPVPNDKIKLLVPEGFNITRSDPRIDDKGLRTFEIRSPATPGTYEITLDFSGENAPFSRSFALKVRPMYLSDYLLANSPEDLKSSSELWYTEGMVFCGFLTFFTIYVIYLNSNKH